jgi:signal transduction histidine kinase
VVIRSDHDRIAQVIGNLLDNAAKYGGGRVEVAVTRTPKSVDLSVRDNGEGIPAEDQAHIFERFVRGSARRVADTAGSGLGLYISRQVARRLGADLICESTEGIGSTFILRLHTQRAAWRGCLEVRQGGIIDAIVGPCDAGEGIAVSGRLAGVTLAPS